MGKKRIHSKTYWVSAITSIGGVLTAINGEDWGLTNNADVIVGGVFAVLGVIFGILREVTTEPIGDR